MIQALLLGIISFIANCDAMPWERASSGRDLPIGPTDHQSRLVMGTWRRASSLAASSGCRFSIGAVRGAFALPPPTRGGQRCAQHGVPRHITGSGRSRGHAGAYPIARSPRRTWRTCSCPSSSQRGNVGGPSHAAEGDYRKIGSIHWAAACSRRLLALYAPLGFMLGSAQVEAVVAYPASDHRSGRRDRHPPAAGFAMPQRSDDRRKRSCVASRLASCSPSYSPRIVRCSAPRRSSALQRQFHADRPT